MIKHVTIQFCSQNWDLQVSQGHSTALSIVFRESLLSDFLIGCATISSYLSAYKVITIPKHFTQMILNLIISQQLHYIFMATVKSKVLRSSCLSLLCHKLYKNKIPPERNTTDFVVFTNCLFVLVMCLV